MDVQEFNALSQAEAEQALRPCLDVPRWIDDVTAGRPYDTVQSVLDRAEQSGAQLSAAEVDQAMAHHPRIGEQAKGTGKEATLSRDEQAGLGTVTDDVQTRLAQGNAEYEERFDRVFLIRAAGRSPEEILTQLERRMENSPEQEVTEVAEQLNQIASLRLKGLFS
ncbi:MAG TPA: 2-oxo-4-hydroxy-4-carboxy-5-ureidoimidazoline decarboxylase [Candidatus Yaniella excrementigallinarum]|nr:2-oxo-4-hydroxy-4-carboxy-5-ureidoimidazoline decarboxylase [Candidatus Yaniella excrementigallinarum]